MKKTKPKSFAPKKAKATPREVLPDRKVTQIAVGGSEHWLVCDDGSVWFGNVGNWVRANIDGVIFNTPPAPPPAPETT